MTLLAGVPEIVNVAAWLSAACTHSTLPSNHEPRSTRQRGARRMEIVSVTCVPFNDIVEPEGMQAGSAFYCHACRIEPPLNRTAYGFIGSAAVRRCSCVPIVRQVAFLAANAPLRCAQWRRFPRGGAVNRVGARISNVSTERRAQSATVRTRVRENFLPSLISERARSGDFY